MVAASLYPQGDPKIHGHRGARGRMPENSLAAVTFAIASGAHGAEVDISASSDDILVVHHDLYLSSDLACNRHGKRVPTPIAIRSQTVEQLKQFDIGQLDRNSEYGKRFPEQIALPGTRIPTLIEYIDKILENADSQFVFNIELKSDPDNPDLVPSTVEYIDLLLDALSPYLSRKNDFTDRLFFQSFDWRLMLELMSRGHPFLCGLLTDQQLDGAPRIPLKGNSNDWTARLDLADYESVPHMIASTGANVWSSQFNDLNPELVDEAHDRGLRVYCWTVNEIQDMEKMIALGVDVITTDYPDRLVQLLNQKNTISEA